MFCQQCRDNLFFEITKKFIKIRNIDKIRKVYDEENKKLFSEIVKKMLTIVDEETESEIIIFKECEIIGKGKIKKLRKAFGTSILFNWITLSGFPIKIFCDKHPKFKDVYYNKIFEISDDPILLECKYWKGKDFYLNKF